MTTRVVRRLSLIPFALPLNREVRDVILDDAWKPDLVFVNKGLLLFPSTLQLMRNRWNVSLVHLFNDDYFHFKFSSRLAITGIPFYDMIFTPCRFNVSELRIAGAQRVSYLPFGYDPDINRPVELTANELHHYRADISFIGSYRPGRAKLLERLAKRLGPYSLRIWGNSWNKLDNRSSLRPLVGPAMMGLGMAKLIAASRISLALITRFGPGRTIHVMRTFEIPACRGFMLAERANGEYQEFYREGEEIACFADVEELAEKMYFYLENEGVRAHVAEAGYTRLLAEPYSYIDRAREVLSLSIGADARIGM